MRTVRCNGETTEIPEASMDDRARDSADFRTQSGHYALAGEGLAIGYDSGDAVSSEYEPEFPFTGGEVIKAIYDVANDVSVNVERELAAALARDRYATRARD